MSGSLIYVLNRSSGEILSVHAFVTVNATQEAHITSGMLRRNPAKATQVNSTTTSVQRGPVRRAGRRRQRSRRRPVCFTSR
jgi:hypothetical protein